MVAIDFALTRLSQLRQITQSQTMSLIILHFKLMSVLYVIITIIKFKNYHLLKILILNLI